MRWQGNIAPRERERGARPQLATLCAPLVVLSIFSLVVRSADSSSDFRVDKRLVLQELKRRIAQSAAPTVSGPPELREFREVVRRGDTFGAILHRVGVISDAEVSRWLATSRSHPSLSRLQPDHAFTFIQASGTDRLAGLQYEISPGSVLVMRDDGGEIAAEVERLPRMVDVRVVGGMISTNLYAAASRVGIPDSVISALVDVFGWEVDFTSDLHAGDSFRVAYEEHHDGRRGRLEGGRVLAAELNVRGQLLRAVYFDGGIEGNYYSPDGRPFGRSYLRYPVEFTRISSQFASSRFHPVLGVRRPHLGVDFAAPIGTPVRAIAAGRVGYAGWKGGSGRYVKIDHGSGMESSYSHLKSISVRAGSYVQVGQVIGSVGASGLATGPHLHFALYRNGVYVNPMTVKLPAAPPLGPAFLQEFQRTRDDLLQQLAHAIVEPETAIVASADLLTQTN